MSILGKEFDLPLADSKSIIIGRVVQPQIMAFDLPPSSAVANEALAKMAGTFDGAGPFSKPASGSKTFEEYKAGRAGLSVVGNKAVYTPTELSQDQVDSFEPAQSVSAATVKSQSGSPEAGRDHMVRLTEKMGVDGSPFTLYFKVMPEIVEARNVSYEAVAPVQFPGAFQKYKGTDSVQWTINATFICRTTDEATENLKYINVLRAWTQPFFGENTSQVYPDKLGAPPPVLILEGFKSKILGPVPVVITSLNWNWPRDVDYIPARSDDQLIPFPTVMQIAIQVVESFSTDEFNKFSLRDYRNGNFSAAFSSVPAEMSAKSVQQGSAGTSEEAQTIYGTGSKTGASAGGGRGFVNPQLVGGAGGGRGVINPELASSTKAETKIASGGGGNFGGGGANGDF